MELRLENYTNTEFYTNNANTIDFERFASNISTTFKSCGLTLLIGTDLNYTSTLLENLYGFTNPTAHTSGKIYCDGHLRDHDNWISQASFISSRIYFYPALSVKHTIVYCYKFHLAHGSNTSVFFRETSKAIEEKAEMIMKALDIWKIRDKSNSDLNIEEIINVNVACGLIKETKFIFVDVLNDKVNYATMANIFYLLSVHARNGNCVIINYDGLIHTDIFEFVDFLAIMAGYNLFLNAEIDECIRLVIEEDIYDPESGDFCFFLNQVVDKRSEFYDEQHGPCGKMYGYIQKSFCLNKISCEYEIDQKLKHDWATKINSKITKELEELSKKVMRLGTCDVVENTTTFKSRFGLRDSLTIFQRKLVLMTMFYRTIIKRTCIFFGACFIIAIIMKMVFHFIAEEVISIKLAKYKELHPVVSDYTVLELVLNTDVPKNLLLLFDFLIGFFTTSFLHFAVLYIFTKRDNSSFKKKVKRRIFYEITLGQYSYSSYIFGEFLYYQLFYIIYSLIVHFIVATFKFTISNLMTHIMISLIGSITVLPVFFLIYKYIEDFNTIFRFPYIDSTVYTIVYNCFAYGQIWMRASHDDFYLKSVARLYTIFSLHLPNTIFNYTFLPLLIKGKIVFDKNIELLFENEVKKINKLCNMQVLFFENFVFNSVIAVFLLFACICLHFYIGRHCYTRIFTNITRLKTTKTN